MTSQPEFSYQEFEDYLFNAIQLSRNLSVNDCSDSEDVRRQLRLAMSIIEMFERNIAYYIDELEPKGDLVAPGSREGIDKID